MSRRGEGGESVDLVLRIDLHPLATFGQEESRIVKGSRFDSAMERSVHRLEEEKAERERKEVLSWVAKCDVWGDLLISKIWIESTIQDHRDRFSLKRIATGEVKESLSLLPTALLWARKERREDADLVPQSWICSVVQEKQQRLARYRTGHMSWRVSFLHRDEAE
jgi:hypothetical protein